jgi:hypothetical protein
MASHSDERPNGLEPLGARMRTSRIFEPHLDRAFRDPRQVGAGGAVCVSLGKEMAGAELTAREIVANPYCRVLYDRNTGIARFVRTDVAIRTVEEADRFFGEAARAIDILGRNRIKLIIDIREAPARNDPQFEVAMADHRREIARGVRRIAVIARTAAGRLHAKRLGKADHLEQVVVSTEVEAIAYLMETEED